MTVSECRSLSRPSALLFDLDGTLVDSADGILWSFEATLHDLGRDVNRSRLREFIGPPLDYSFTQMGFGADEMDDVLARYRVHYEREGVQRCQIYDGIETLLVFLAAQQIPLAVATAKRVDFANQILTALSIAHYFPVVAGASLDGRLTAKDVIVGEAIARLDASTDNGWLVGDRRFDVAAAHRCGLVSVGVTWGYGSAAELQHAGASVLVDRPHQLVELVAGSSVVQS